MGGKMCAALGHGPRFEDGPGGHRSSVASETEVTNPLLQFLTETTTAQEQLGQFNLRGSWLSVPRCISFIFSSVDLLENLGSVS